MMLHYHPPLAIPAVNESEPGLYGGFVFEGEGIDAGVDGELTESADVCLIDFAHRPFSHKMDKIVLDFFVVVANLIGHGGKQNAVRFIENYDFLGIPGLEGTVPLIEEYCDFIFVHVLSPIRILLDGTVQQLRLFTVWRNLLLCEALPSFSNRNETYQTCQDQLTTKCIFC